MSIVKKLSESHNNYQIDVNQIASGSPDIVAVQAVVTLFTEGSKENPSQIVKKTSAFGSAKNLERAENKALEKALVRIGL